MDEKVCSHLKFFLRKQTRKKNCEYSWTNSLLKVQMFVHCGYPQRAKASQEMSCNLMSCRTTVPKETATLRPVARTIRLLKRRSSQSYSCSNELSFPNHRRQRRFEIGKIRPCEKHINFNHREISRRWTI